MTASPKKSLEYLLVSKVRIKALKYFVFNSDVPIHLRGAVRELKEEINAVRRELNRLEEIEFLITERRGNRKYFSLNLEHPYIKQIMELIHKAYGLGGDIIRNHKKVGEIDYAILTKSFTHGISLGTENVDLILIGDIEMNEISSMIDRSEKNIGREINYTVLTMKEFNLRKKRRDPFVMEVLLTSKTMLIGREEDFMNIS